MYRIMRKLYHSNPTFSVVAYLYQDVSTKKYYFC